MKTNVLLIKCIRTSYELQLMYITMTELWHTYFPHSYKPLVVNVLQLSPYVGLGYIKFCINVKELRNRYHNVTWLCGLTLSDDTYIFDMISCFHYSGLFMVHSVLVSIDMTADRWHTWIWVTVKERKYHDKNVPIYITVYRYIMRHWYLIRKKIWWITSTYTWLDTNFIRNWFHRFVYFLLYHPIISDLQ